MDRASGEARDKPILSFGCRTPGSDEERTEMVDSN